ncbi:MAG: cytochrome c [Alphaproteobacteria bacterium]|nr:cytochrome c [Alphaproteobacteria bacterium]
MRLIFGTTVLWMLLDLGQSSFAANMLIASAGNAEKGEIIGRRWCAACHLVAPDQTKANSDVPSFATIAHKVKSSQALNAFLTDPHPKMPDMNLTRDEIEDLVAYIGSLRK